MRIGCLFGTFDPPHKVHVAIAGHMRTHRALDQVWMVVTPANPFKQASALSPEGHRLAMVRLALMRSEGIQASGLELDLPKPSYTVDSLRFMRQRWPHDEFVLIIGSDNLAHFHTWKDADEILAHHRLLVYPRPGFDTHLAATPYRDHPQVDIVSDAPMMDVSSTAIREAIRSWKPLGDLVAPAVVSYVREHKLYV
jgi:nicotinate-nucleotide adenylyltransferase